MFASSAFYFILFFSSIIYDIFVSQFSTVVNGIRDMIPDRKLLYEVNSLTIMCRYFSSFSYLFVW